MLKKFLILFVVVSCVAGCGLKRVTLKADMVPGKQLNKQGLMYVERFSPDKRNLHILIADQLSLMGYQSASGESGQAPKNTQTVVTYVDKWQWDITNYLRKITISFRDYPARSLVIQGESSRTSLVRKPPVEVIRETLDEMMRKH